MSARQQLDADESLMRAALAEARKGIGKTGANPTVGAVISKNGKILSCGWHRGAGKPHAEIEALRCLKSPTLARGASLHVTLEPCSTHGRTPPCTEAIIAAGFKRVVFGATDPNPKHAGRAAKILASAGIETTYGVLGQECARINRAWNKWIATGIPYVTAKAGMSLDGRISSPPDRRWITSPAARRDAMRLRAECGAILVGAETVRMDNPLLTIRGLRIKEQPFRVVWSRSGDIPSDCHLLTDEHRDRTLVYARKSLSSVLRDLGKRGIQHVLIEGGGHTLGEALDRDLIDHIVFYIAPVLLGGPTPAVGGQGIASNESAIQLKNPSYRRVGSDLRVEAEIIESPRVARITPSIICDSKINLIFEQATDTIRFRACIQIATHPISAPCQHLRLFLESSSMRLGSEPLWALARTASPQ
jgi:diaminohydroxyphosphoribosylaminopyrimidine deaminase/5-amino-6-(5-phosphoribosylamino)uracil reductase